MTTVGLLAREVVRRLPPALRGPLGVASGRAKIVQARSSFRRVGYLGGFLDVALLSELLPRYEEPPPVRYDSEGLVIRAREKFQRISSVVDLDAVRRAVELGCMDGMLLAGLASRGVSTFGLDLRREDFDERARRAGTRFVQGNAEELPFSTASTDLVCSFAALEHFSRPDLAVFEAARILRPGGYLYLSFGPLYFSPYGRHAYRQIPVPFCHLLFREEDLHRWASERGLHHAWPYVNGWSLRRYRQLWERVEDRFETVSCREHTTGGVGAELIARYAASFRRYTEDFDEFLVAGVELCLRRRGNKPPERSLGALSAIRNFPDVDSSREPLHRMRGCS